MTSAESPKKDGPVLHALGEVILSIKWGLVPLYLGLYIAIGAYLWKFGQEVLGLVERIWTNKALETEVLLSVLTLIDITMIGNLIVMTTIGGYTIFVKEFDYVNMKHRPRWLNVDFNSTTQKIKMGMSLIGVSAIHLAATFYAAKDISWDTVWKEVVLHMVFVVTTIAYCFIDKLQHPKPGPKHDHE
jgi:uncharacterized protein (TIGR00645 family)